MIISIWDKDSLFKLQISGLPQHSGLGNAGGREGLSFCFFKKGWDKQKIKLYTQIFNVCDSLGLSRQLHMQT